MKVEEKVWLLREFAFENPKEYQIDILSNVGLIIQSMHFHWLFHDRKNQQHFEALLITKRTHKLVGHSNLLFSSVFTWLNESYQLKFTFGNIQLWHLSLQNKNN